MIVTQLNNFQQWLIHMKNILKRSEASGPDFIFQGPLCQLLENLRVDQNDQILSLCLSNSETKMVDVLPI